MTKRLTIAFLMMVVPSLLLACSVPVFRYALEHWRPDAYQVFIYHENELTDADRALVEMISERGNRDTNLQVKTVQLNDATAAADRARWQRARGQRAKADSSSEQMTPAMVVQLPVGFGGGNASVGTSDWNESEVKRLLDSPARQQLGRRLVDNEVVWVFLDSGDESTDQRLFEVLNEQIAYQQETLELPEIEEHDLDSLSTDPDELTIRFSSLRVSRSDPAESWFVEMLMSVEPDLRDEELASQPMVFPVFGRGRALYALVGAGINPEMISQAASFLTGACQCTVKAENPGVDLLIPVSWDELIQVSEPEAISLPLVGLGSGLPLVDAESAAEPIAPSPPSAVDSSFADASHAATETSSDRGNAVSDADTDTLGVTSSTTSSAGSLLWLPLVVLGTLAVIVGLMSSSIIRRKTP